MSALVEALCAQAFRRGSPAEADALIDEVRAEQEARGAQAFSYELFVPAVNVEGLFLGQALARLVNFLSCRGFKSARAPGVFISLFTPEGLFFIEAGHALEVLSRFKGLSVDELYRRYGDGGVGDPLQLGP